jgi:O-antigen/teichoic acid export membrane protein
LPLAAFGYYAFALTVAQTPLGLVAPLAQAFFPRFSALQANADEHALASTYHAASQLVAVLLGSATMVLVVFGDWLLALWTKDNSLTHNAHQLVVLLALGSLLNGLMTMPYYLQLAAGWTGLTIRANLVALALVAPALALLVPRYGAIAAAWTWFALNAGYFVIVIPALHARLLRAEKWRWYLRDVTMPLAVAALTSGALRLVLPAAPDNIWQLLELLLSASLVLFATALSASVVRTRMLGFVVRDTSAR